MSDSAPSQQICSVVWELGYFLFYFPSVPPSFDTSNMQSEVQWFVNQTRFLDCPLHGIADPPAMVEWERHGIPVVSGPDVQISPDGSRLMVPRVSLSDAGEYRCVASNEVGRTSQTFRVLVFGKYFSTFASLRKCIIGNV